MKTILFITIFFIIGLLLYVYLLKYKAFKDQPQGVQKIDWYLRWGSVIIVILTGLTLTTGIFEITKQDALNSFQMIFKQRSAERIRVVTKELNELDIEVRELGLILTKLPSFDRNDFTYYTGTMVKEFPIQAIAWVPRVKREERLDFENRAQLEGFKEFQFKDRNADGKLVAAVDREVYFPVYYEEPLKGNELALGFDLSSEPERAQAMEKSRDEGCPIATPPIALVQKIGQKTGVLIFMPVYTSGPVPQTVNERRANLRGYIVEAFTQEFLKEVYSKMPAEGLAALVEDLQAPPSTRVMYRHKLRLGTVDWNKPFSKFILPVEMTDRAWQITILPGTVFMKDYLSKGYLFVFPIGIVFTSILSLFIYSMFLSRFNAQLLVRLRTSELQESNRLLERASAELRDSTAQMMQSEKLTALGEMAGGIAHELNQPLNVTKIVCQGILKDIQKDRLDLEELKVDLPEIVNQMNKMAEIIDHMRKFTTVKKSTMHDEFEINSVIENAFKFTGAQMASHGVKVTQELAAGLPLLIGDPIAIEEVVLNMLTNARSAIENSEDQEKKITVKTYLSLNKDKVCIEISDNGPGIPGDIHEKIFQPFFTTQNAVAPDGRPVKGKGLGLFVAQKTVREHGGEIVLTSTVGQGATFKIILPVKSQTKANAMDKE